MLDEPGLVIGRGLGFEHGEPRRGELPKRRRQLDLRDRGTRPGERISDPLDVGDDLPRGASEELGGEREPRGPRR